MGSDLTWEDSSRGGVLRGGCLISSQRMGSPSPDTPPSTLLRREAGVNDTRSLLLLERLAGLGRSIRSPFYAAVDNSQGSSGLHHTPFLGPRSVSRKQIAHTLALTSGMREAVAKSTHPHACSPFLRARKFIPPALRLVRSGRSDDIMQVGVATHTYKPFIIIFLTVE